MNMKKLVKLSVVLLMMLGVAFTSCKKEYPEPPIQVLPVGTVYALDEILAMESGTIFNEDASVYGIVTADEKSGNLYKSAYLQDRATGAALELHMNASSGVRIGDSIRVYLKDVTYSLYNGLPQLSNFEADGHIVILANNKPIEPVTTTIANINAGQHLAQLVRLENVMFSDKNTFADPTTYGNRTLLDPSDPTKSVIVRTSNYANFANDSLPQGTGNLVAIAAVYNSTWQLYIRSASELEFDGFNTGGDDTGLPYFPDFSSSFGTYTTYSVAGDQQWEIDYSTAKITGYANSTNYVNEDWLISAPVALTDVEHVKVAVNYVAQYQNSNTEDVTLQISKDYVAGSDPLTANWTQMNVTYPNTSGWSDFQTVETSLDEFLGETVTVAIKYTSSETQARTLEVKYIVVQEGEAGGGGGGGGGGQGGETQSMPYTQSFATDFGTYVAYDVMGPQSWEIDYSTAKMTGYVGGAYNANEDWLISSPVAITGVSEAKMTMVYIGRYFSDINEEITVWASTDYEYATDPSTASWTQVVSSLSEGTNWNDFLTAEISLTEFVGQTITVAVRYTSTAEKAGTMEIQSITIEEGSGITPTPPGPGTLTGDGSRENPYTANDIILLGIETSDGNKYWVKDYIVGFVNGSYVYEFTAATDVKTNLILSSNVNTSLDTECIPVQLPVGAVRDGLNLVDNPGNLQQEVLLYGTLEKYFRVPAVKNVTYAEINGVSIGTDPGVTPPTPQGIFAETFASGQGDFVIEDVLLPEGLTHVWSHAANYSCMKASAFVSGQAYETESWLVSPSIDLSSVSAASLSFEQAVNYADPTGVLKVMITTEYVDTVDGIEWTELELDAWPAGSDWTFITSTVDLTPYVGRTVNIAFQYTSTTSASATWEVKNFVVQ